ncbi:PKD domain-containing protein [uncultured Winogradskyella sp.]|uniref:PKD domain-containing protein n=1 Tax=uncultured Winogradskyella sp. TaxID=395353 RepID=UPI0026148A1E|nr:PKD domain-containing protein [uncultured Winogradskyella sp.]
MKTIYKITKLLMVSLVVMVMSCEDNESGVDIIGLEANFTYTINARTITFTNISNDAVDYSWDFGDGDVSSLISPIKTYEANGTYTVVLTAFDAVGNSETTEETFVIDIPICIDETSENIDPANGPINWTFLTTDGSTTFSAFGATAGFIVGNPVIDNVNQSCNVQRFEKTPGCQTFAGLGVALASPIDFSTTTNKTFTMKVLAENQLTEVTLRLEFMSFPNTEPSQDRVATITQLGEWQELTFDFTDIPSGTFQSMIIYFERDATCDGDIYYFDDIIQQ